MASEDPRSKNTLFDASSLQTYMVSYAERLAEAIQSVPAVVVEQVIARLRACSKQGRQIYVGGNGGSAAISDHLCCDWTKGTRLKDVAPIKTTSLVSNNALLTALANDFSYEESLSWQIETFGEVGDVVVLISSSGNSPNILKAAHVAKEKGLTVIGFSGFTGGALKDVADISVHVAVNNYGVVEDAHQALMHVIAQYVDIQRKSERVP